MDGKAKPEKARRARASSEEIQGERAGIKHKGFGEDEKAVRRERVQDREEGRDDACVRPLATGEAHVGDERAHDLADGTCQAREVRAPYTQYSGTRPPTGTASGRSAEIRENRRRRFVGCPGPPASHRSFPTRREPREVHAGPVRRRRSPRRRRRLLGISRGCRLSSARVGESSPPTASRSRRAAADTRIPRPWRRDARRHSRSTPTPSLTDSMDSLARDPLRAKPSLRRALEDAPGPAAPCRGSASPRVAVPMPSPATSSPRRRRSSAPAPSIHRLAGSRHRTASSARRADPSPPPRGALPEVWQSIRRGARRLPGRVEGADGALVRAQAVAEELNRPPPPRATAEDDDACWRVDRRRPPARCSLARRPGTRRPRRRRAEQRIAAPRHPPVGVIGGNRTRSHRPSMRV